MTESANTSNPPGAVDRLAELLRERVAQGAGLEPAIARLADSVAGTAPDHLLRVLDYAARDLSVSPYFDGANDLHTTAHHEAGHAIVSEILGHPVAQVDIVASISLGHLGAMCPERRDDPPPDRIEGRLAEVLVDGVITMAGLEAEELATGYVPPERREVHEREVYRKLCESIVTNHPGNAPDLTRYCAARARALVWQHKPLVVAVARALLAQRTLTGDEVRKIMTSTPATR